ncbi:hypothetical protein KI387_027762, partial [Taxus chinensis]
DGERCLVMPTYNHCFHVGCAEAWLSKKPLFPICRASALPKDESQHLQILGSMDDDIPDATTKVIDLPSQDKSVLILDVHCLGVRRSTDSDKILTLLRTFAYKELRIATDNFKHKLGSGALQGFYAEKSRRLLVYEYMPNGSDLSVILVLLCRFIWTLTFVMPFSLRPSKIWFLYSMVAAND